MHIPTMHPADLADGIPTNCETCGKAIHYDGYTGLLSHGFDPALED